MFELNSDQIEEIRRFKNVLGNPTFIEWYENQQRFSEELNRMLRNRNFDKGNDLSLDDLYHISEGIVRLIGNVQLAIRGKRSTFESNDLTDFNKTLRELLYGKSSFPQRVETFLRNKRVGIATMSQFLMVFKHEEYPYFGNFMNDVFDWLGIDADQHEEAAKHAEKEFGPAEDLISTSTADYLKAFVILREIKNKCDLESHYLVQNLLWNIYAQIRRDDETEVGESTEVPFGMESTLRDYLALNPHSIEKGMSLVQTEYPTVVGPIDLLCKDRRGRFVVVEVKKTKDSDKAVGKILRYMGAIKEENKEEPRGILILYEEDQRINYALKALNNVQVKYYRINFSLTDGPSD